MNILKIMAEKTQFELVILTMVTSNNEGTITQTFDYHFTRDKEKREIVSSKRYNYVNLGRLKGRKTHKLRF